MMVTAAAGGTLTAGGGSLLIPAGVLAADQMLTVTVKAPVAGDPGRENIVGDIYDFGPSGTKFSVPVQLTLPLPGAVPADKKAVVAWLDEASGEWFTVATTVSGDKVTGLITHFTRFAVLQIPKETICPYAGACGGSLDGTWKYSQTCLKPTETEAFKCGDLRQRDDAQRVLRHRHGDHRLGPLHRQPDAPGDGHPVLQPCLHGRRARGHARRHLRHLAAGLAHAERPAGPARASVGLRRYSRTGLLLPADQRRQPDGDGRDRRGGQQGGLHPGRQDPGAGDDFCVRGNNLSVRTASGDVYTAIKQ